MAGGYVRLGQLASRGGHDHVAVHVAVRWLPPGPGVAVPRSRGALCSIYGSYESDVILNPPASQFSTVGSPDDLVVLP